MKENDHKVTDEEYFRDAIGQACADELDRDLVLDAVIRAKDAKQFNQIISQMVWIQDWCESGCKGKLKTSN